MKPRVKELVDQSKKVFQRDNLLSLWQRLSEHFYPERADFTTTRSMGEEFASHLMTGWPVRIAESRARLKSAFQPSARGG